MTYASPAVHNSHENFRIAIEGMHFEYGRTVVFENFKLDLKSRQRLILLEGPSGCGKTTFLKLLAGVLTPSKVEIFLHPQPARLVLQEDSLFPWLSVTENLACLPGWKGIQNCQPAVRPLVSLIEPLADHKVYTLSFGQRRLVELFRVLYSPTALICLDEPFNFLDPAKREIVARVIENLADAGFCFVIASHYREDFHYFKGVVYKFDGNLPISQLKEFQNEGSSQM